MNIISPIVVVDSMIGAATSITEPSTGETAWVSGGTYAVGDLRIRSTTHRVYSCVQAHTGRTALPEVDSAFWLDKSPTQKYAPFDIYTSTAAVAVMSITYVLTPGYFNALALYGLTGTSLSVTIKDAPSGTGVRKNLLTYSEQFDNAAWAKGAATVTANAAIAPDGTLTMDKIVPDTSAGFHIWLQNQTGVASTAYTLSVFFKAAGYNFIQIQIDDSGANSVSFSANVSNGTVSTAAFSSGTASAASGSIVDYGNGIYRVILSGIPFTSGTALRALLYVKNNSNLPSFTGDGTSGIFVWGAQLEQGSTATSYQYVAASSDYYIPLYTQIQSLSESPLGWYEYLFSPRKAIDKVILKGLPIRPAAELTVTVTAATGQPVGIGMLNVGDYISLLGEGDFGGTQYGASAEPVSYSYIKVNPDGTTSIVRRVSATNMRASVFIPLEEADQALQAIQNVLDVPVSWIATDASGYAGLNVFGLGSASVSYDGFSHASLNIQVKGLI